MKKEENIEKENTATASTGKGEDVTDQRRVGEGATLPSPLQIGMKAGSEAVKLGRTRCVFWYKEKASERVDVQRQGFLDCKRLQE